MLYLLPQTCSIPSLSISENDNLVLTVRPETLVLSDPLSHTHISNMLRNPIGSTSEDSQQLIAHHPGSLTLNLTLISHVGAGAPTLATPPATPATPPATPHSLSSRQQPKALFKDKAPQRLSIADTLASLWFPEQPSMIWL